MKPCASFNVRGRSSRGQYWLQSFALILTLYAISALLGEQLAGLLVWLVNGAALAMLLVLSIRRLHDRNYSAWWLFVAALPVIGALWLIWQLAIRSGLDQDNRWGSDPRQAHSDYLVVG